MKFRSPTETPVYVAELSGHCAVIGPEWREVPQVLHRKALMEGCITDNMTKESIAAATSAATPNESNHDILVRTIKSMMSDPKEGDFTAADLPNLKRLSSTVGWIVDKEEMMQAVHAIAAEG